MPCRFCGRQDTCCAFNGRLFVLVFRIDLTMATRKPGHLNVIINHPYASSAAAVPLLITLALLLLVLVFTGLIVSIVTGFAQVLLQILGLR